MIRFNLFKCCKNLFQNEIHFERQFDASGNVSQNQEHAYTVIR